MKYYEKVMKVLFDRFPYENVKYVCHHSGDVRGNMKNTPRLNQELTRLDCQFYLKIKKISKIILRKNKNLTHNHPIETKIYKNYLFIGNKDLIK